MNVIRPAATPVNRPAPAEPRAGAAADRATTRAPSPGSPEGTSSLWEILTAEEREFFAQGDALGPVTYHPARPAAADPAAPTGRRVDVRG